MRTSQLLIIETWIRRSMRAKSDLSFVLHPLPLLNISDYYTRATLSGQRQLAGILFGTRNERDIVIENAFETKLDDHKVDVEYLSQKLRLYSTTFPGHQPLGWFCITDEASSQDPSKEIVELHDQFASAIDLPIVLMFNPRSSSASSLPVRAFQAVFNEASLEFSEVPVKIDAGDAERISVDDIITGARSQNQDHLVSQLVTERNALQVLHSRLSTISAYIKAVRAGAVEPDQSMLRRIHALTSRLQSQHKHQQIQHLFNEQELNGLITAVVAVVTSGLQLREDVSAKQSILVEAHGAHQ